MLASHYPCLRGAPPTPGATRRAHAVPGSELTVALVLRDLSPLECAAISSARMCYYEMAQTLDRTRSLPSELLAKGGGASGTAARRVLTRRNVAYFANPLGVEGECAALGTLPASPKRRPRSETAAMDLTPTAAASVKCVAARCDFTPPPRLHLGLCVTAGTMLRVIDDSGDICSVRVT